MTDHANMYHRCNKRLQHLPKKINKRVCYFVNVYYFNKRHMKYRTETEKKLKQDAQLSQRDRAAGCVTVFAISRILELGDNILRTL